MLSSTRAAASQEEGSPVESMSSRRKTAPFIPPRFDGVDGGVPRSPGSVSVSVCSLPPVLPPIPRVASTYESSEQRWRQSRLRAEKITSMPATDKNALMEEEVPMADMADTPDREPPVDTYRDSFIFNQASPLPLVPMTVSPLLPPSPSLDLAIQSASPSQHPSTSPAVDAAPIPSSSRLTLTSPPDQLQQSMSEKRTSTHDAHAPPLGIPYASTVASTLPRSGDRPLKASTLVNGVKRHERTSTPQSPKAVKRSSLNFANLLGRRKSSHNIDPNDDATTTKALTVPPMDLPDDYDPRIRGNVVHDFSAPRTKRHLSYNDGSVSGTSSSPPQPSLEAALMDSARPTSVDTVATQRNSKHTPIFTEHLDDATPEYGRSAAINAETLANNDFVSRLSWQGLQNQDDIVPPPFGRPSQQMEAQATASTNETQSPGPTGSPCSSQPPATMAHIPNSSPPLLSRETPSPALPSASLQQTQLDFYQAAASGLGINFQERLPVPQRESQSASPPTTRQSGLHKHSKSNASRFSFQIAAQDSIAEEKALEEKHKASVAFNTGNGPGVHGQPENDPDDMDDFFDESAMYDHDEFEGMHEDGYEDNDHGKSDRRDDSSQVVRRQSSSAMTKELSKLSIPQSSRTPPLAVPMQDTLNNGPRGLTDEVMIYERETRRNQIMPVHPAHRTPVEYRRGAENFPPSLECEEAAAMFDASSRVDDAQLGQSQHTKDYSMSPYDNHPNPNLFDAYNTSFYQQETNSGSQTAETPLPDELRARAEALDARILSESKMSDREQSWQPHEPNGAQQGHVAYQSALAVATHQAAATGKFSRQASTARSESNYSNSNAASKRTSPINVPEVAGAVFGNAKDISQPAPRPQSTYSGFDFGFNDAAASFSPVEGLFSSEAENFDDDFMADDSLISAANADALASDDEGFYGQEYGFYANARSRGGQPAADAVNGGFFGPMGIDTVQRQWSVREPNLTPITERSEFSARNSYVSMFGPASANMQSPTLAAQMASMSPLALARMQEEDLSFEQFRRLKSSALGGIDSSPRSESGFTNGSFSYSHSPGSASRVSHNYSVPRGTGSSPMVFQYSDDSAVSSMQLGGGASQQDLNAVQGAHHLSNGSPDRYAYIQSPTAGASPAFDPNATPRKTVSGSPDRQPQSPATVKKPTKQAQSHARKGSGTEHVTYVQERDAGGASHWVMERRRTGETGMLELVGREIVEGGRI